jgi:hypothetical protein
LLISDKFRPLFHGSVFIAHTKRKDRGILQSLFILKRTFAKLFTPHLLAECIENYNVTARSPDDHYVSFLLSPKLKAKMPKSARSGICIALWIKDYAVIGSDNGKHAEKSSWKSLKGTSCRISNSVVLVS